MNTQGKTRKVDFRISEQEYKLIAMLADNKGIPVSAFLRQMLKSVLSPTLLCFNDEQIETAYKELTAKRDAPKNARIAGA